MNDSIIQAIGTVGFPIAVAVYCLVVLNKTMKECRDAIKELLNEIKRSQIEK